MLFLIIFLVVLNLCSGRSFCSDSSSNLESKKAECKTDKECIWIDGHSMASGERLIYESIWFDCFPNGELREIGCSTNGEIVEEGNEWANETNGFRFRCDRNDDHLEIRKVGCVDGDRILGFGDQFDSVNTTFECSELNGIRPIGCFLNLKRHRIGEQWTDGDFVFYCKRSERNCQKICIGCEWNGRHLYNGDRFRSEAGVYQCEIKHSKHQKRGVACVSNGIERVIGCKWKREMNGFNIEEECYLENDQPLIRANGCFYRKGYFDLFFIPPQSYTIWTDPTPVAVVCFGQINDSNSFRLETFDSADFFTKATVMGIQYSEPKG